MPGDAPPEAFGRLTLDEKRSFIRSVLSGAPPRAAKTTRPGVFNPTRTELLKTFRLDEPLVKGSGHRLFDAQGREYLDFLSQYGAVPFGQNPPALWEILRQAESEQMVSMIQPLVPLYAQRLAERLGEITPGDLEACTFTNSGAEAIEAAIKLARARTGRPVILSAWNSFHGKTLGALSATGRPMYQKPFRAPVPDFDYVPYGDVGALDKRLSAGDSIAAFIVEPIQGEGGVVPAPPGYLAAAFELCRRHGVLTIVDEIQTGLGRTGSLFATPPEAGTPDILVLAKALGGGLIPVGACIARRDVWDEQFGRLHSSTFANNNLACRIGLGVIDLLLRDDAKIIRHVEVEGRYLADRLAALQARYPNVIKSVRGKGFMAGVEFHQIDGDQGSGALAYFSMNDALTALFSAYLFNVHHIVTAPTFNSSHVVRLQPPFTVGRAEIDRMVAALDDLCDALERADCYQLVRQFVEGPDDGRRSPASHAMRRRSYAAQPRPAPAATDITEDDRTFAFVAHYTSDEAIVQADPSFESFTDAEFDRWKDWGLSVGPGLVHRVGRIQSAAGSRAVGWLFLVPMLPRDMLRLGRATAMESLERVRAQAKDRGASVLGLGGFTSIISRGGLDLAGDAIAITSGNTLTSVMSVAAIEEAACRTGFVLSGATVAVVGATGSIGRLVSLLLAERVAALTLIGNSGSPDALGRCQRVAAEVGAAAAGAARPLRVQYRLDLERALADADVVVVATNADSAIVSTDWLLPGTLVCDVAQPPNVTADPTIQRDVLVFSGGLVRLPQPVTLGPATGLAPGICWGCLGETIVLALEGSIADSSLGELTVSGADAMARLAEKHAVRSAPLQHCGREFTADDFDRVRLGRAARDTRRSAQGLS